MICRNCGNSDVNIIYDDNMNIKQFVCKTCHQLIEDATYPETILPQNQVIINYA